MFDNEQSDLGPDLGGLVSRVTSKTSTIQA